MKTQKREDHAYREIEKERDKIDVGHNEVFRYREIYSNALL